MKRRWPWILWLLIALMPVRGIAQSLMSFAPANGAAVTAVASAADATPCPMHAMNAAADDGASTMAASGDGNNTTSPACGLCSVCHSAVLPLPFGASAASAMPDDEPLPAHGLGAGRAAPAELFRPPR